MRQHARAGRSPGRSWERWATCRPSRCGGFKSITGRISSHSERSSTRCFPERRHSRETRRATRWRRSCGTNRPSCRRRTGTSRPLSTTSSGIAWRRTGTTVFNRRRTLCSLFPSSPRRPRRSARGWRRKELERGTSSSRSWLSSSSRSRESSSCVGLSRPRATSGPSSVWPCCRLRIWGLPRMTTSPTAWPTPCAASSLHCRASR